MYSVQVKPVNKYISNPFYSSLLFSISGDYIAALEK